MKYTIDRPTWLRGEMGGSFLLRPSDGKMCCLGHVALQCGLSRESISGLSAPQCVLHSKDRAMFPSWLLDKGTMKDDASHEGFEAMKTNDNTDFTDEEREAKLNAIFARNGDELEFVNNPTPSPYSAPEAISATLSHPNHSDA